MPEALKAAPTSIVLIKVSIAKTAWEWDQLCNQIESAGYYEKVPELAQLAAYIRGFIAAQESKA